MSAVYKKPEDYQILDIIPAQICLLKTTGDIFFVNKGWRKFAAENCYDGTDFSDVNYLSVCAAAAGVEAKTAGSFGSRLQSLLRDGTEERFSMVYPCHAPDAKRWFKATAQALECGAVVTHTDITEEYQRIEAEARVLTSAGVIHDLRSPLNAVIGFADLSLELVGEYAAAKTLSESLGHIRQAGGRMLDLVNDLLDYAQEMHDNDPAQETPVDPAALMKEITIQTAPAAARLNVTVSHTQTADFRLLCDERSLWKLLLNLVSNAVKYNRPGGSVRVFLTLNRSGGVEIGVQDTGVGMPSDRLAEMFAPFARSDAARVNPATEGTGIGLALVREIVRRHDGVIHVSSAPGVGTSINLIFPTWRTVR